MNINDDSYLGKKCNDPGISNNNSLRQEPILAAGVFLTLQVLNYYCVPGYLIEGKNSITCQEDGIPAGCHRILAALRPIPHYRGTFFLLSLPRRILDCT